MSKISAITRFFSIGILLVVLIYSPFALDLTLTIRFTALAVLLLATCWLIFRSKQVLILQADVILLFYLAYTCWCVLSLAWANTRSEAVFESLKVVLSFSVFCVTLFLMKHDEVNFLRSLGKISTITAGVLLFFGIWQYVNANKNNTEYLYSVTGINGHKNLFASFLFLNLFFLVPGFQTLEKRWKTAAIIVGILSLLAILMLRTKAVWLGGLVTVLVYAGVRVIRNVKNLPKIRVWAVVLITIIITNIFFFMILQPCVKQAIADNAASPEQERLVLWDKTCTLISKRPFFGTGMGNWQIFFPDATLNGMWRVEDLNFTFQRPHNDFLWILSETGLIGFNLFLLFLSTLFFSAIKAVRHPVQEKQPDPFLVAIAFMAGFYTISFFDFPKERMEHMLWLNMLLGIIYFQINKSQTQRAVLTFSNKKVISGLTTVLLVFTVVTGFLRHQGEFYTKRMSARTSVQEVIKNGRSAVSFAYTIDPTSVPIVWYLGNVYASQNNFEEAHRCFLEAYRLTPFNRNVLNDLASSYATMHDEETAKKLYLEASRISPRFDDPKLNLIAIYINEKNYKLASDCIQTLAHDSERRKKYQRIIDAFK